MTKQTITNNTVVKLTEKGLSYSGRANTARDTAKQWEGCKGAFSKVAAGQTTTVGKMLEAYKRANPENVGDALANVKYHIRSGRLAIQAK